MNKALTFCNAYPVEVTLTLYLFCVYLLLFLCVCFACCFNTGTSREVSVCNNRQNPYNPVNDCDSLAWKSIFHSFLLLLLLFCFILFCFVLIFFLTFMQKRWYRFILKWVSEPIKIKSPCNELLMVEETSYKHLFT